MREGNGLKEFIAEWRGKSRKGSKLGAAQYRKDDYSLRSNNISWEIRKDVSDRPGSKSLGVYLKYLDFIL